MSLTCILSCVHQNQFCTTSVQTGNVGLFCVSKISPPHSRHFYRMDFPGRRIQRIYIQMISKWTAEASGLKVSTSFLLEVQLAAPVLMPCHQVLSLPLFSWLLLNSSSWAYPQGITNWYLLWLVWPFSFSPIQICPPLFKPTIQDPQKELKWVVVVFWATISKGRSFWYFLPDIPPLRTDIKPCWSIYFRD